LFLLNYKQEIKSTEIADLIISIHIRTKQNKIKGFDKTSFKYNGQLTIRKQPKE
jgi:hypothetical protein